jgi:hypothetical protein
MEKKTWQRPELIVLVHAQPEQTLLQFCKGGPAGVTSPQASGLACVARTDAPCQVCYVLNPS